MNCSLQRFTPTPGGGKRHHYKMGPEVLGAGGRLIGLIHCGRWFFLHSQKLTRHWKIQHSKMHFLLKMGFFQCHLNFPGVLNLKFLIWISQLPVVPGLSDSADVTLFMLTVAVLSNPRGGSRIFWMRTWKWLSAKEDSSGWCFQPIWKICSSNWIISPGKGKYKIFETTT